MTTGRKLKNDRLQVRRLRRQKSVSSFWGWPIFWTEDPHQKKALLLWLSCLEDEVPWAAISAYRLAKEAQQNAGTGRHRRLPGKSENALWRKHQASASEISVAEVRPADPAIARAVDRSQGPIRDLGRPKTFGSGRDHRVTAGRP